MVNKTHWKIIIVKRKSEIDRKWNFNFEAFDGKRYTRQRYNDGVCWWRWYIYRITQYKINEQNDCRYVRYRNEKRDGKIYCKRLLCVVSTRFVSSLMVVNGCEWISSESSWFRNLFFFFFSFLFFLFSLPSSTTSILFNWVWELWMSHVRPYFSYTHYTIKYIHLSASWIRQCKQFW